MVDGIAAGRRPPVAPQTSTRQGRYCRLDLLVAIMEGDLSAGVRQRIVEVVAARDITILEAELVAP